MSRVQSGRFQDLLYPNKHSYEQLSLLTRLLHVYELESKHLSRNDVENYFPLRLASSPSSLKVS